MKAESTINIHSGTLLNPKSYHMPYCIELQGSTINILEKSRTIRMINKTDYHAHTNPLFLNSHVMKLNDLFYYKISNQVQSTKG